MASTSSLRTFAPRGSRCPTSNLRKELAASPASTIPRAIRSSCGNRQPVEIGRISAILAAMAIRRIYETPDPVLRQISKPVELFDGELKTLVADMFETMYEA